ncbi:sigma-70 family RNA polymerase sigma factor [Kribbella sp. NPDC051770]|uniref:RNA polymerase sigma factor n=1 Tax=Kribbella sp. NPDC051770 TaxID=3155413 RepID=UPI0034361CC2
MESDAELVVAAQAGVVGALGVLLGRHRARMTAVAVQVVGFGPDAEDAVQEAMAVALARIGDVRDPASVGAWLRTVVRNACRMQLRGRRTVALDELRAVSLVSGEPDPAEVLEGHVARDWVWHALEQLSPPLRLVMILRYFTGVTTYQEIAELCGVPVGTVRSRLSEGRAKLTRSLLATADASYDDVSALAAQRWREVAGMLEATERGELQAVLDEQWAADAQFVWSRQRRTIGLDHFVRGMYQDIEDGVRGRVTNVLASGDLTVSEIELINPADDPFHCPPAVVWVQEHHAGRIQRCRLFHADRPTQEAAA